MKMKKFLAVCLSAATIGAAILPVQAEEATKMTLILRGGTYAEVIKQALPEFEEENNC